MGVTARNSIKGYSYQQHIFTLFLGLMDTERKISKIVLEAVDTMNFDDLYVEYNTEGNTVGYRIQVKDYPGATLRNTHVKNNKLTIQGNDNTFNPKDNNIVFVNSSKIPTNDTFLGFKCVKIEDVVVIPLIIEDVENKLDDMFSSETRELQIIHTANIRTDNAIFEITIDELPPLIQLSNDLGKKTVLLRKVPEQFEKSITFIEGRPGIGKSHYSKEVCEKFTNAIVYRFWVGSQDKNGFDRLMFDRFITELGILVYKSSKKVIIDELIDEIKRKELMLIIDGLDHVENYNPKHLDDYFSFFEKLTGICVLIFSRPLKHEVKWHKMELLPWTFDETRLYLSTEYSINDYDSHNKIYDISGGYPIVTFYLAEEFLLTKDISYYTPITNLDDYYKNLFINNEKPSWLLALFAAGNCFFTKKEIAVFYNNTILEKTFYEFIDQHPYLFFIVRNRISLFHDSFNTYIRENIDGFELRQMVLATVKESVLNGEIEYAARMDAFEFDEDFYKKILIEYSDIEWFEKIILSTRDFDSIQNLYGYLQRILERRKGVLDIYQYYSFALIYQIAHRTDLIGDDSLIYQMLCYMHNHEGVEDSIYSSGYIWNVYLMCNSQGSYTQHFLEERNMSESQFLGLCNTLYQDYHFFEKLTLNMTFEEFQKSFETCDDFMEKREIFADYLISIFVNNKEEYWLYDEFMGYINDSSENFRVIMRETEKRGLDEWLVKYSFSFAKYRLHELGLLNDKNRFRNKSLLSLVVECAGEGSFDVVTNIASYLKLANYEKRDVDIKNLAYVWAMYYQRKDYSVFNIYNAFLCFEKKGEISEQLSLSYLSRMLGMSEKGISSILTDYLNNKDITEVQCLIESGTYKGIKDEVRFFELDSNRISLFSKEQVMNELNELFKYHYSSKTIEARDIRSILKSKYANLVISGLEYFGYSVLDADEEMKSILETNGIVCLLREEYLGEEKNLKDRGYIKSEDIAHIKDNKIDMYEIASYADGWYSCLPYVDIFMEFPKKQIQENYLSLIHSAMFAKVSDGRYFGNWYLLAGNIPKLIDLYEIEVDWNKMYAVLERFLEISLIKVR